MRILVVDDELPALLRLQALLREQPGVELVATCTSAAEAIEALAAATPDLVLLDIEMPEVDGIELAATLGARHIPVIFVSGHQEQAVNAFDVEAVDFVTKPVERHRLRRALDRARSRVCGERPARPQYLQRLLARDQERLVPIPLQSVDYLEALGNHVKVHHAAGSHTIRTTLRELERRLDPRLFVRTHRSYIVNVARIAELRAVSHGDYTAHLQGGTVVPFSRAYRTQLARLGYLEAR